jgi:hypothetical protein
VIRLRVTTDRRAPARLDIANILVVAYERSRASGRSHGKSARPAIQRGFGAELPFGKWIRNARPISHAWGPKKKTVGRRVAANLPANFAIDGGAA